MKKAPAMDFKAQTLCDQLTEEYLLVYNSLLPMADEHSISEITKRFEGAHTKESFTKLVFQVQANVELSKRVIWFTKGALELSFKSDVCAQTLVRAAYETLLDAFYIFLDPLPPELLKLGNIGDVNFFSIITKFTHNTRL